MQMGQNYFLSFLSVTVMRVRHQVQELETLRLNFTAVFNETSMRSRNRDRSTLVLLGLFEFWQQWRWRRRPITLALYKPHLVLSIYGSLPGAFSLSLSSTLPTAFDREKTAWRASTRLFCIQIVLSCSSFLPAVPPLYIDID